MATTRWTVTSYTSTHNQQHFVSLHQSVPLQNPCWWSALLKLASLSTKPSLPLLSPESQYPLLVFLVFVDETLCLCLRAEKYLTLTIIRALLSLSWYDFKHNYGFPIETDALITGVKVGERANIFKPTLAAQSISKFFHARNLKRKGSCRRKRECVLLLLMQLLLYLCSCLHLKSITARSISHRATKIQLNDVIMGERKEREVIEEWAKTSFTAAMHLIMLTHYSRPMAAINKGREISKSQMWKRQWKIICD